MGRGSTSIPERQPTPQQNPMLPSQSDIGSIFGHQVVTPTRAARSVLAVGTGIAAATTSIERATIVPVPVAAGDVLSQIVTFPLEVAEGGGPPSFSWGAIYEGTPTGKLLGSTGLLKEVALTEGENVMALLAHVTIAASGYVYAVASFKGFPVGTPKSWAVATLPASAILAKAMFGSLSILEEAGPPAALGEVGSEFVAEEHPPIIAVR